MKKYEVRTKSAAVFEIHADSLDWDGGTFWNDDANIIAVVNMDNIEYIQFKGVMEDG